MPFFVFDSASAVLTATRYLNSFDDTVRFTLTSKASEQTLYMTTANIHPFCYTDFSFRTSEAALPEKRQARDEKVGWAINSDLLVRVLGCFDAQLELTFSIEEDASFLLLLQQTPDAAITRVMQIGVIHDLGPSLSVDHGIEELYCIDDVEGFRQVARSAAISEDPSCRVYLSWGNDSRGDNNNEDKCHLRIVSTSTQFTVLLGTLTRFSPTRPEGRIQCADMERFALLCERALRGTGNTGISDHRVRKDRQQLSIGFGGSGLSLLRLRWFSPSGERTASLFFCAG